MNKEQIAFIQQPNTHGVLIGIPGGGKSTSIIHRIIRQVESSEIPAHGGFLVVTFSRAAADDFRRKGARLRSDLFDPCYIRTIHSLAGTLMRGVSSSTSSIHTVVCRATKKLRDDLTLQQSPYKNIKVIYVDEAQDISRTQYELVMTMGEILNAAVVLVGDADQALYAFQGGSPEFLNNHRGFRIELVQNYRSTCQIVNLANGARPTKDVHPMKSASGTNGSVPYIVSDTHANLATRIIDIVTTSIRDNKVVAIIGPTKRSGYGHMGSMRNIGLQWAHHILKRHGVPVKIHYNESLREEARQDQQAETSLSTHQAHLFTIHGSKGLEFDTVILLNFHKELMGNTKITQTDVDSYKCLVYVGITRAKQDLWILHRYKREVWPEFHDYEQHLILEGEPIPHAQPIDVATIQRPRMFHWTNLINDRVWLPEERLTELEDIASISVATSGNAFPHAHVSLPDQDKIHGLYGAWAENTFENLYRGQKPKAYRRLVFMLEHFENVPHEHVATIKEVYRLLGLHANETLLLSDYTCVKQHMTIAEDTNEYITRVLIANKGCVFFHIPGITRFFDKTILAELIRACDEHPKRLPANLIWRLCLFHYQYEYECKYRWYFDYSKHVDALEPFEKYIEHVATSLEDGYEFDMECVIPNHVRGFMDVVNVQTHHVIELKFTSSFTISHGLQAVGYGVMHDPASRVTVINLRTQKTYDVSSPLLSVAGVDTFHKFITTI